MSLPGILYWPYIGNFSEFVLLDDNLPTYDFLLNDVKTADIHFHFPQSRNTLHAHKIVLSGYSNVFKTMFFTDMKYVSNEATIDIIDVDKDAFMTLLK